MSRITYFSEKEGYDVAANIRKNKYPCDVIHFDTGWFDVDWQCDYKFSENRFQNPQQMLKDLRSPRFPCMSCGSCLISLLKPLFL